MTALDDLALWSSLSLEEQEEWLQDPAYDERLERLFGREELEEMRELLQAPKLRGASAPVVLLPGGGGSELHSVRGIITRLYLEPHLILQGLGAYLKMNPEGTADANPAIEASALRCMPRAYDKLRLFLSKNAWLHEFPYDWRCHVEETADQLHVAIERWATGVAGQKLTLVCHSMGGVVARAYLALHPKAAEERIQRAIMLGSPHYGAISMVLNLLRGDFGLKVMGMINPANIPMQVIRSMPGLFQLMPPPLEHFQPKVPYPVDGGWDLYRAESWRIEGIEQPHLDAAAKLHALLAGPAAQVPLLEIAGCHIKTAVAVKRTIGADEVPHYEVTEVDEGANSGDGTVPLWSTQPPGGKRYFIQAKHGDLPRSKQVLQAVLRLIEGDPQVGLPDELPPKRRWRATDEPESAEPQVEDADQAAERVAARLREQWKNGAIDPQDLQMMQFGL